MKELRSIDRSVDDATFKLKLAELTEALAETRIALSEAREVIAAKESEIRQLNKMIEAAKSGESCPICKTGTLSVMAVREHPTFGVFGHQEHDLRCTNEECSHREKRKFLPPGAERT